MIRQHDPQISAADFLPATNDPELLRRAAETCRGCDLHERGARTVFGAGPAAARLVFIGDQPDQEENVNGLPFSGPAGRLFDAVLADVGIDRRLVYVTNVVKHFPGFSFRGAARRHPNPKHERGIESLARKPQHATKGEMRACRPWLEAELAAIQPAMIVCLGAVAARAVFGPDFRVSRRHGEIAATAWAPWTMATYHPAAILRNPDATRADIQQAFSEDLRTAARQLRTLSE